MQRFCILDEHTPVLADDPETWVRWFGGLDSRRVGHDEIGDMEISTVCLGMDYGFGHGPPLIFETKILNGARDGYEERYATWEEAEAGHARAVALVKGEATP